MKIVFCEDGKEWIESLNPLITSWAASRHVSLFCNRFASHHELINYFVGTTDTDVLFLDISFTEKGADGMALARRLRKMGNNIPVIFVTLDPLRAADGYLVEAMGVLSRPVDENRLTLFLDRLLNHQRERRMIKIMAEKRLSSLYQKDILYVEIMDHTVICHTVKGNLTFRESLGKILDLLGEEYFMQIHRSYAVALERIDSIKTTYPYSVRLYEDNHPIDLPVSRKYINQLLKVFSEAGLVRI